MVKDIMSGLEFLVDSGSTVKEVYVAAQAALALTDNDELLGTDG